MRRRWIIIDLWGMPRSMLMNRQLRVNISLLAVTIDQLIFHEDHQERNNKQKNGSARIIILGHARQLRGTVIEIDRQ
jgi:hypothetical protein